ncbi:MAG: hypothetical protein ACM3ZB_17085 [bacterium]|jgi:hypothetical protein
MTETSYRNRRAFSIENDSVRVTVLVEGGHVAEILHKPSGTNPLWTPPWPSIEPSAYARSKHPQYGADAESRLLAGLMGHNVCLDIFGGVSPDEEAAGLTVHGEAPVAAYAITGDAAELIARAELPGAQLRYQRRIALDGMRVCFAETVENLSSCDRPIAWTQHVTLGPPFLERGATRFEVTATRSKVLEADMGAGGYLEKGAEFEWPNAPRVGGGKADLRTFTNLMVSAAFTTHLMDPALEEARFTAHSPRLGLTFGYRWPRAAFPWLGIWEENYSRTAPPWNGRTLACGMEFGVSPVPETRRRMIERGTLFGVPTFKWLGARRAETVRFEAFFA